MSKVKVAGFSVSLDGFSAGVQQSLNDPLGKRGTEIFQVVFPNEAGNRYLRYRKIFSENGCVNVPLNALSLSSKTRGGAAW